MPDSYRYTKGKTIFSGGDIGMNAINVSDLKPDLQFKSDVVIDKTFLLLTPLVPVSQKLIDALNDWSFTQIFTDDAPAQNQETQKTVSLSEIETQSEEAVAPRRIDLSETESVSIEDITGESLNSGSPAGTSVKRALDIASGRTAPDVALQSAGAGIPNVSDTDEQRITLVKNVYNEYLKYIESVYTYYATNRKINMEDLSTTVEELCRFIKDNRQYVLRIQAEGRKENINFLIPHSLNSTILAIIIAMELRYTITQMVELGTACILHEIGMIRLPPQLYMTDRILTPSEKKVLFTHPLQTYNILKSIGFPLQICLGALDHHERENGSGYPRKLESEKISRYGKIIAVACAYEAASSKRAYKEAKTTSSAMIEMLRDNNRNFDASVIRALFANLSLYPIGSYVFLSNGKCAQVVDVVPESPQNPVVKVIAGTNGGKQEMINTANTDIKIMRAMDNKEVADILKYLKTESA